MSCIEARGLHKSYGANVALAGIDLSVEAGRILGLIGPNGAGKTTALNAILGLTPYQGDLKVLGRDPWRARHELMRDVCFIADAAGFRLGKARGVPVGGAAADTGLRSRPHHFQQQVVLLTAGAPPGGAPQAGFYSRRARSHPQPVATYAGQVPGGARTLDRSGGCRRVPGLGHAPAPLPRSHLIFMSPADTLSNNLAKGATNASH